MWLSYLHRRLVHKNTCVSNICHGGENGSEMLQSSHMRHDIESYDQCGENQDKAWLDGPVASVKGKLSDDLAPMDEASGEKQVRSRLMNQYGHMMI